MTTVALILRTINGVNRQIDLSASGNALQVNTLIVGLGTTSTLTQTILANLIGLQNGTLNVATSLHAHDGIYTRTTALSSTTGGSAGSTLIGDDASYTNFTPAAATVKGALSGIDTKLGTLSSGAITSLTGDVTASGPGAAAATVAKIQGTTVSGTTGTGNVVFSASPTVTGTLSAATITASGTVAGTNLTSGGHAILDLALTGGTMSGAIAMGGSKITGLGAPTANGDALRFDQLGANSGIATLDSGGKVPASQLPNSVMEYLGTWAASTNTPALANGTGSAGSVYVSSDAGTVNFGAGNITFAAGDWVVYSGSVWEKSINSNAVASVNGQTGAVTVNAINQLTGDVTAPAASGSVSKASTVAAIQGTAVSGTTGTGNVVFSAAPTLTGLLSGGSASFSSTIAASNFSGSSSGTNTGDQTITLTGDVTGSGTGSFAATIGNAKVSAAQLATGAFDQTTITGGAGSAAAVQSAPLASRTLVAGEAYAATTTFCVRWAIDSLAETAGRVYKADYDAATTDKFWAIGLASAAGAVSAGGNIGVTMLGEYTLAASDTPFSAGAVGKAVWLTASGAFSTTAPSAPGQADFKIGVVQSTTKIWVNGQMTAVN